MSMNAEVVIIGGGVIGASVAYHLTRAGCRDVLIIEREAQQGLGSTGQATGGVRAQFSTDINIAMSLYSIDFFRQFTEATDHECGYEPRGYLFVATSDEQFKALTANRVRQQAQGLTNVELWDRDEVARNVPSLRADEVVGAAYCPTDGFIDPLGVMAGFTTAATRNGARIELSSEVTGFETEAGSIIAVNTNRGRIGTRTVICAAGAWAGKVAALAGVELPVEPLRRQIVWALTPEPLPQGLPMVIDLASGFHFRPARGPARNELLLAWPDPAEPMSFRTEFDPTFIPRIMEQTDRLAPFIREVTVDRARCRAGLYEMTPDHHPIIGPATGLGGLYLVNGFSGHGVMHSPAAGRMIAETVLHGESRFMDAAPLDLKRFEENRLFHEAAFI
jgi:sarcosine oxidase subunit beta